MLSSNNAIYILFLAIFRQQQLPQLKVTFAKLNMNIWLSHCDSKYFFNYEMTKYKLTFATKARPGTGPLKSAKFPKVI